MSRVELLVVIGAGQLLAGLCRGRALVPGSQRELPISGDSLAACVAACDALADAGASVGEQAGAMRVLVADPWLMACRLPWSDALLHPATAEAFARARLTAAGFDVQPADVVRLGDSPYLQPRRAVGYPAALMAALARVAQAWGGAPGSVVPLSEVAWQWTARKRVGAPGDPLAVWFPGGTLVLQGDSRLIDVAARFVGEVHAEPATQAQALATLWQRMGLRNPRLAQAVTLRGLNLWPDSPPWPALGLPLADVGPVGTDVAPLLVLAAGFAGSALDAVQGGGRRGSVVLRVAAAALLALSLVLAKDAHDHWRVNQDFARLEQSDPGRRLAELKPGARELSRDEAVRVGAVNAAIRELNMPVSALIGALQVPRDLRVALLSVDMTGASTMPQGGATVKVVAEARTGAEMARYVAHIADRRPIARAYLMRHEVQQSNPARPYRFTVEAVWVP